MPTTIFQDRLNGDPSYNAFKKYVEIGLDKIYQEVIDGKQSKIITVTSDELVQGVQVQCIIQVVHRKD